MASEWLTFQSWSEFSQGGFSAPKSADVLQSRIKQNLSYYRGNYLIVAALILLIACYFYPGLFVFVALTAGTAAILLYALKSTRLVIGGVEITYTHKYIAIGLVAALSIYFTECFVPLLWTLGIAGVVILVHASLKGEAKMGTKMRNFADDRAKDVKEEMKIS